MKNFIYEEIKLNIIKSEHMYFIIPKTLVVYIS